MRATGNGPMGALLMLAPLVAIPILAVVGIPNFAGGNLIDLNGSKSSASSRDDREPAESRLGDAARHDADDLFAPLGKSADIDGFDDPLRTPTKTRKSGRGARSDDEFPLEDEAPRAGRSTGSSHRGRANVDELSDLDEAPFDDGNEAAETLGGSGSADQFPAETGKRKKASEERFADNSDDLGADQFPNDATPGRSRGSRVTEEAAAAGDAAADEQTNAANPFEPAPVANRGRPAARRPAAITPPRDPHDAPAFVPTESAAENEESIEEPAARPPVKAPAAKTPLTKPRVTPRTSPTEEELSVEPQSAPAAAKQAPPIDELTWQVATRRLRALGVGKSKQYFTYLEDRDVFLFTCTAMHRQDSEKTQRFQAEADDPLLAVRQVLEKLETWQTPVAKRAARSAN